MISISWTTFKKLVISCRLPGYQYWLCLSSFNSLASRRLLFLPATFTEKSFTVSWFIHYLGGILARSKHCCKNLKLAAGALCPAPTLQKNSWSHSQKCKKKKVSTEDLIPVAEIPSVPLKVSAETRPPLLLQVNWYSQIRLSAPSCRKWGL